MVIHGIDVILYQDSWMWDPFSFETGIAKETAEIDPFGRPEQLAYPEVIHNVLVAPQGNGSEVLTSTEINGKKDVYILGIPKGDAHDWKDRIVEFFGRKYRTFGPVVEGIDDLIPGPWNRKVQCERYE